jgi:two-component system phosphate regulon sensor histidine kinase PhoR
VIAQLAGRVDCLGEGRDGRAGDQAVRKAPRSIVFYAWAGLAVQALLVVGVGAFVLAGASYQTRAITVLHERAQSAQVGNVTMQAVFLDAQRALRGYQATRRGRFLQTFYADQDQFVILLAQLRRMAWRSLLPGVSAQADTAQAAFAVGDAAATAPKGRAPGLYERASAASDAFIQRNHQVQRLIAAESDILAAHSEQTLGVGLAVTAAILAAGLMIPMVAIAVGLRWTSAPLRGIASMVRRRALGDTEVRLVPGGPADVRDLAASINLLADESDRLRSIDDERAHLQDERAHLQEAVREASTRIRQNLHAADVIREAVAAIEEHLETDFAWVGLVRGEDLHLAEGDREVWDQVAGIVGYLPPDSVDWMREIYRQRASYCVQDLHGPEAEEIPAVVRKVLLNLGASSLLLTAFGAGSELLGVITLLRNEPGRQWTAAEIAAVESLATDIGRGLDHARLYEDEQHLVTELQSLDQAKTSFLASASHDLRTPLTSILGYVEILADAEAGPIVPQQATMLDAVARNARRLQTLIEDMLTISTIELGKFTSSLRPVDLAAVVPRAAEVIRPSAADKDLVFEVDCPPGGLMVDGDAGQLDRVVVNLLSNAVKYTPRYGRVTLTASGDGDQAVLTVADTGMGIPEQDQKSLFTRFFRASNAVERAVPGSGLGLSIVRSVVANHHGAVTLESAEDRGTTVTVRIPLLGPEHAGAPAGDGGRQLRLPESEAAGRPSQRWSVPPIQLPALPGQPGGSGGRRS